MKHKTLLTSDQVKALPSTAARLAYKVEIAQTVRMPYIIIAGALVLLADRGFICQPADDPGHASFPAGLG